MTSLISIPLKKKKTVYTEFFYVGFSASEVSNLLMFQRFYNRMLPSFGEGIVDLQIMDTESITFSCRSTKRLYVDIKFLVKI